MRLSYNHSHSNRIQKETTPEDGHDCHIAGSETSRPQSDFYLESTADVDIRLVSRVQGVTSQHSFDPTITRLIGVTIVDKDTDRGRRALDTGVIGVMTYPSMVAPISRDALNSTSDLRHGAYHTFLIEQAIQC